MRFAGKGGLTGLVFYSPFGSNELHYRRLAYFIMSSLAFRKRCGPNDVLGNAGSQIVRRCNRSPCDPAAGPSKRPAQLLSKRHPKGTQKAPRKRPNYDPSTAFAGPTEAPAQPPTTITSRSYDDATVLRVNPPLGRQKDRHSSYPKGTQKAPKRPPRRHPECSNCRRRSWRPTFTTRTARTSGGFGMPFAMMASCTITRAGRMLKRSVLRPPGETVRVPRPPVRRCLTRDTHCMLNAPLTTASRLSFWGRY